MLAFEQVAGLLVVKRLLVPLDDGKIFSVVIGVALHASLAGSGFKIVGCVKPAVRVQSRCDFRVTLQALECRLARRKLVASNAKEALNTKTVNKMSKRKRAGSRR